MSYTITLTDGSIFATIPDGTINTGSSMTLVGKNYAGYGQFINDDIIRLLENGSNSTAPGAPLVGQLWWDTTSGTMKVFSGSTFKVIPGATASSTYPTVSNVLGDLWYDTVNAQLNVYGGIDTGRPTGWILVGPSYTGNTGVSGAIVTTITDTTAVSHVAVEMYVADSVVGIFSKDTAYTPAVAPAGGGWSGSKQVQPGLTMSGNIGGVPQLLQGTANNSLYLGGVIASSYVQNAGNALVVSGTLTVNSIGNATAIINGAGNALGNIGSSSSYFNQIFAQSTTALYADVAERFAADEIYEPGTVVELGGTAEITRVRIDASDSVFGVISTRPAFTMNGGAGNDDSHPPVAITGRVPVKVTGIVTKGDRLISAGDGLARAAQPGEATSFNVIGRALSSKSTVEVGTVKAIVTIK